MRFAIANDMLMAREALRRVIAEIPDSSLAWTACDGAEAVKRCVDDTPDLILMDLIMPVMNGVEATREIMARAPCAILVVTATVEGHTAEVFEALGAGALDAVQTPVLETSGALDGGATLRLKIETVRRLLSKNKKRPAALNKSLSSNPVSVNRLLVIGASAGGPAALAVILHDLPVDFPAPVIVVQHIDAQFAPSMATWLDKQSALHVRVAEEHDRPQTGTVLIAASNDHLVFVDSQTLGYTPEPRNCHYRPSIDVFFESVIKRWMGNGDVVAVLLTGMGRDGAKGLRALRLAGALTIAQDADSCVVYGMPKAAADLGAAIEILPLHKIASRVTNSIRSTNRRSPE